MVQSLRIPVVGTLATIEELAVDVRKVYCTSPTLSLWPYSRNVVAGFTATYSSH